MGVVVLTVFRASPKLGTSNQDIFVSIAEI